MTKSLKNKRYLLLIVLLLAALVTITLAAAEKTTNSSGAGPIVNENGTVTIDGITLPVAKSKAYPLNASEFSTPLTREQFIAGNQNYIEFLAEHFGKELAEKMVNDEYDRLINQTYRPDTGATYGQNTGSVPVIAVTTPPKTHSAPFPAALVITACAVAIAVSWRRR